MCKGLMIYFQLSTTFRYKSLKNSNNYSSCVKGVFQNPLTCKTFLSNQNPNWAKYFLCGNATSATFDKKKTMENRYI